MAALTISRLLSNGYGPEWVTEYLSREFRSANQNSRFKKKRVGYTSAAGPTSQYGADVLYANILTIGTSATTTLDPSSIQDLSGQTESFARIRAIWALLLGLDDNGGISAQASSVTIGAGASNGCLMFLANSSDKVTLTPGRKFDIEDYSTTGLAISGSTKTIEIINADSSNAATLALAIA